MDRNSGLCCVENSHKLGQGNVSNANRQASSSENTRFPGITLRSERSVAPQMQERERILITLTVVSKVCLLLQRPYCSLTGERGMLLVFTTRCYVLVLGVRKKPWSPVDLRHIITQKHIQILELKQAALRLKRN